MVPDRWMPGQDGAVRRRGQFGAIGIVSPRPCVSEPELREDVDHRLLWASVTDRNLHQNVLWRRLGVLDEDIEVAVVIEDVGVDQLTLGIVPGAPAVLLDELRIGKRPLWVLVEHLQVRMRRRGIQVVIELLDVLAMIGLIVGEAEETLLQNRVMAIPQRHRQAQVLLVVADACDRVLAPAIRPTPRLIVAEVFPGGATARIVFPHRSPLTFAEIGSPASPGRVWTPGLFDPKLFPGHDA